MTNFRRIIYFIATVIIIVCAILLFTAYDPGNPTHRRYSSEVVLTIGDPGDIGLSGEIVLSKDLGIPRNDEQKPRLVVCNKEKYEEASSPPEDNTKCIHFSKDIVNYRIPDFVTDDFMAEAKNSRGLLINQKRNYEQIKEIAKACIEKGIPLWLFVRHNTLVDNEYHEIVEETGGRILYYFSTEGYVNPTDHQLALIIAGTLCFLVSLIILEKLAKLIMWLLPDSGKPKSSVVVPEHKSSRKARNTVDDYDQFMRSAGENARKTLDD